MPSKIQGVLCATNWEAVQRLNITVEQLSEQLHEVHLNPMFVEILRQLQELRAKLASRDAEVERLLERVTRLERDNVTLKQAVAELRPKPTTHILAALPKAETDFLDAKDFRKIGHIDGCICVECEDMRGNVKRSLTREQIRRRT